jgi:transposase-like protein
MKQKHNPIPDELKFQIVEEYLTSNITQRELLKKFNIQGNNLDRWIRNFGLRPNSKEQLEIQRIMLTEVEKTPYEKELEAKVKELEEMLKHEKFLTLALNTMIDVAERDLKIQIRKKPGAKQ